MKMLTEREFNSRMKKLQMLNIQKERLQRLKAEENKHRKKIKFPSTSKLILFAVFIMCIEILIFSQYAMIKLQDTSAMYVLIGVPVSIIPIVIGYYSKSAKENTVGGITYETALHELNQFNCEPSEESYEDDEEAVG